MRSRQRPIARNRQRSGQVRRRIRRAFTLIEILLVVMIIAVVAGFAITAVFQTQQKAYTTSAQTQIDDLKNKVNQYRLTMGKLPPDLEALHTKPSDAGNSSDWYQIIDEVPQDPWNNDYTYKVNGSEFEIISAGPDSQMNTEDDISSKKA